MVLLYQPLGRKSVWLGRDHLRCQLGHTWLSRNSCGCRDAAQVAERPSTQFYLGQLRSSFCRLAKRSETRSVSHAFRTLTWKKKKCSLLFASNFLLPTKAKLIQRIFALFCFQKLFVSLRFVSDFFILLQSKAKSTFLHFVSLRSEKQ